MYEWTLPRDAKLTVPEAEKVAWLAQYRLNEIYMDIIKSEPLPRISPAVVKAVVEALVEIKTDSKKS